MSDPPWYLGPARSFQLVDVQYVLKYDKRNKEKFILYSQPTFFTIHGKASLTLSSKSCT